LASIPWKTKHRFKRGSVFIATLGSGEETEHEQKDGNQLSENFIRTSTAKKKSISCFDFVVYLWEKEKRGKSFDSRGGGKRREEVGGVILELIQHESKIWRKGESKLAAKRRDKRGGEKPEGL